MCSPYSENGLGWDKEWNKDLSITMSIQCVAPTVRMVWVGQGVKQGSIYHHVHSMYSPYSENGLGWDKEWNKDLSMTMSIQCVAPTVRMVWGGTRSETRIYLWPCPFNVWPLQWEWFGVGQGVKQGSIYDHVHSMCGPYSENGLGWDKEWNMCGPYSENIEAGIGMLDGSPSNIWDVPI